MPPSLCGIRPAGLAAAVCMLAMLGCASRAPVYRGSHDTYPASTAAWARAEAPLTPALVRAGPRERFEVAWRMIADQKFASAAREFEAWLDEFAQPQQPLTPRAMFWLGYCRERQGQFDRARDAYAQVQQTFPASSAARLAAERAAQMPQSATD